MDDDGVSNPCRKLRQTLESFKNTRLNAIFLCHNFGTHQKEKMKGRMLYEEEIVCIF